MKKLIAVILVLTLLFSFAVVPTQAESVSDMVSPMLENGISVDSTNSFGGLLSQTINAEMEKQLENNGFNVFSVEYNDGEAVVELEALQDCTLFVGIYSEDGTKLITSQKIDVTRDDTLITLTFDTSVVPEYFIIQAYLINTADLKPLCSVYNSNMYTKEMQEFLSKTADDFESDKVLQLDDDKTNNFAVFNDTVEIIEKNTEMTVTADEENGIYTITNPTDEVKALQVGDVFSYNYENGEVLILKIASISIDQNGTITYTEGELELEDVFDYVKIDSTVATADSTIDTSNLEEGIVYNGLVEKPTTYAIDLEGSKGFSHSYDFFDYDLIKKGDNEVTLNGSVEFSLESKLKVYISLSEAYVEFQIEYQLELGVELSGKISKTFVELGGLHIVIVPGVIFVATPSVVFEATGSIGIYGRMLGSIGFKVSTKDGFTNISKTPKFETEFKVEATIFLGLSLKPALEIIDEKIAEASLEGVAGVEVKGTFSKKATTDDERHTCSVCIEGELNAKVSLGYKISLLNREKWTYEKNLFEITLKITDFYFSFEYLEFDFTECPHKEYRLTVNVKDNNGKALKNIKVNIGNKTDTTNTFGNVSIFLPDGKYTVKIVSDKYTSNSKSVTVNGKAQIININVSIIDSLGSGSHAAYYGTEADGFNSIVSSWPMKLKPVNSIVNLDFSNGFIYWSGKSAESMPYNGSYASDSFKLVTDGNNKYITIRDDGYVDTMRSALMKASSVSVGDKLVVIYDVKGVDASKLRVTLRQEHLRGHEYVSYDPMTGLNTTTNNPSPGAYNILVDSQAPVTALDDLSAPAGWTTYVARSTRAINDPVKVPSSTKPCLPDIYLQVIITKASGVSVGDKLDAAIDNIRIAKVVNGLYIDIATNKVIYNPNQRLKMTTPKTATYSLRNTTVNPNEFSGLIPDFIYNYYVMDSDAIADPLNSQNLKFIGQAVSDEYGNLALPEYAADVASSEPTIVLKEFARVSGELEYLISSEGTAIITGCTAENAVAIPEKLGDYVPTAIANMAFEGCYNLTDIALANSVTEIADGAFSTQENINLHSSCRNDNTYFEEFAKEQEIEFSTIHQFGENSLNEIPTKVKDGSVIHVCVDCNHNETLSLPYLKFKPALVIVDGELLIKLKLTDDIFVGSGYENIGVTLNGENVTLNEEEKYFYISSKVGYDNYNYELLASITAIACGESFEADCSESVNSIADINLDTEFNILDLVRMKKNMASSKDCDINGDDSSNSADLVVLINLLLQKQN